MSSKSSIGSIESVYCSENWFSNNFETSSMKILSYAIISVFILFHTDFIFAQTDSTIIVDSAAQRVIDLYKKYKASPQVASGYRVQLLSSSVRADVQEAKTKFTQQFPLMNTYLVYQQPQFKLRAGDFTSRNEALSFLAIIQNDFPAAFVVPDRIVVGGK